ncbi:8-amino-7-oxononanoate synthase [Pedobacter sp. AK017]|uniref:aminotransferase class I/II-fold pyridoxal phosphate-dependent enzyme n=1 Tax=Pedobacter sp. AK017 TaxID=2723073 RepID=UPI00161B7CD3|nr:aminotransferase class I/II-fold pyridoxal phosphate-dependent enzyme [Pedobacter sp. AK017]MBB5436429.1 8-amino-7-oxononanoate synthase [Pedobacter sp. AK017]
MHKAEQFILNKLQQRTDKGILRKLPANTFACDFSSNDYLGFAGSAELKTKAQNLLVQIPAYKNGATGSRLLSGNHIFTEETEQYIAGFHEAAAGLIFNSGYDANVGLLSALAQRGDTVICDELVHASLIDGARLSYANRYSFKHNDLHDLETKLKAAKGSIYVVIESVYSMDGDMPPLQEISTLCQQYQASLIVDEAHATGIFGRQGAGLVQAMGLQNKVFARIVTFGKAMGCHGAIVLGSHNLREYLINFARPFIYTTAAPLHTIATIKAAYQLLQETNYPQLISDKIAHYLYLIGQTSLPVTQSRSAVHTILYQNSSEAKTAAAALQYKGLDVKAILSPTVAEGRERLRICLHLFNTNEEIETLVNELKAIKPHE